VSTFQQGYQLQALKERVKSLELMVAQVPGIQAEQEKIINGKVTRLEKAATINFTTTLGLAFRKLEDHVTDVNIAKQSILTARIAALQEQLDGSQQANTGAKKTYGTNDPIIREAVSEWDDMVRAHFSEIKAETVWQIEELAKSFLTSLV
jgi:hypothetical protein